ncbi:unnamed protein product [Sphagnum balticum]
MYMRALVKQQDTSQSSTCNRRQRMAQRSLRELALLNSRGDSYKQNRSGQITDYAYKQNDKTYTFEYSDSGELQSIASSDGWTWSRVSDNRFDGWLVRNYFDSWDCIARRLPLRHRWT